MKLIREFLEIIYDLVIGDCWQIAAVVALLLAGGIGLLQADKIPVVWFGMVLGVVIMSGAALVIYFEATVAYRRKP